MPTTGMTTREHIVMVEGAHADAVPGQRSLSRHGKAQEFTLRLPHYHLSDGSRYVAFVGCRVNDPQNALNRVAGCFPRRTIRL